MTKYYRMGVCALFACALLLAATSAIATMGVGYQNNVFLDSEKPVITLLGAAAMRVELGEPYTDAGATAADDCDGNLTADMVVVNPVDTSVEGAYLVAYAVSDAAGNAALPVTRTVVVGPNPIHSPSHPDPDFWYVDTTFEATWDDILPVNGMGYAWLLNDVADTTPTNDSIVDWTGVPGSAPRSVVVSGQSAGTHYFHLVALNAHGLPDLSTMCHFAFRVASGAPTITSSTHPGGASASRTFTASVAVSGIPAANWSDFLYVIDDVAATEIVDGGSASSSSSASISVPCQAPGTYWFHAAAADALGNLTETAHFSYTVTNAAPVVSSVSHPSGGSVSRSVSLSWTNGGVPGLTRYYYAFDSQETMTTTGTETTGTSLSLTCVAPGTYWFHVYGMDVCNIPTLTSHRQVLVGNVVPVITSASHPDPMQQYGKRDVTLSWTCPQASLVASSGYYVFLDQNGNTDPARIPANHTVTTAYTAENLGVGTHYFHVLGVDACDIATTTAHFQINIREAQGPVIQVDPGVSNMVKFTWTDPEPGGFAGGVPPYYYAWNKIANFEVTADGDGVIPIDGPPVNCFKPAEGELWFFHIRSMDRHGNFSQSSRTAVGGGLGIVAVSDPSPTSTQRGPVEYLVTYPGATAITLGASDITLVSTPPGAVAGTVTVSETSDAVIRKITLNQLTGNGAAHITLAARTATYANNVTAGAVTQTTGFSVDSIPPGISVSAPSVGETAAGPVAYTVTYTDADWILLNPAMITQVRQGTASAGSVTVSGTDATRVITLSNIVGTGTIGIAIAAGSARDNAGNTAAAASGAAFSADAEPPTLTIEGPSPAAANRDTTVVYTARYNDNAPGGVTVSLAPEDIAVTPQGDATTTAVVSVANTLDPLVKEIRLTDIQGDGAALIEIAADTARDGAGNAAPAAVSAAFTADTLPPTIEIGAPSLSESLGENIVFVVTYGGAASVTLSEQDVSLQSTGDAEATIAVNGTGTATRTVTLSNVRGYGSLGIALAAGTAVDAAGNLALASAPSATCAVDNYLLAATISPVSAGSVAFAPVGGHYRKNTEVELSAAHASGWRFARWEGALTGTESPAVLTMDGHKTVTAVFVPVWPLTTIVAPSNGGQINRAPDAEEYLDGTEVTLTAQPAPGFAFTGWEGDLSGAVNPTTITMNGARSVTARFTPLYVLTLTLQPESGGEVTLDPAEGPYLQGTEVSLEALPHMPDYRFLRWEGALTGTAPTKTLVMDNNKSVSALFLNRYLLTSAQSPSNGGRLTVAPSSADNYYDAGTTVTLTAWPEVFYKFVRWEGDAAGTEATVQTVLDQARTLTAVYEALPVETISGQVTDWRTGETLGGVTVTVTESAREQRAITTALTTADGRYSVSVPGEIGVRVTFAKAGYRNASFGVVAPTTLDARLDSSLPLPPTRVWALPSANGILTRWLPSPSQDVAGYYVWRTDGTPFDPDTAVQLNETATASLYLEDAAVQDGVTAYYWVCAADADDNRGEMSAGAPGTAGDLKVLLPDMSGERNEYLRVPLSVLAGNAGGVNLQALDFNLAYPTDIVDTSREIRYEKTPLTRNMLVNFNPDVPGRVRLSGFSATGLGAFTGEGRLFDVLLPLRGNAVSGTCDALQFVDFVDGGAPRNGVYLHVLGSEEPLPVDYAAQGRLCVGRAGDNGACRRGDLTGDLLVTAMDVIHALRASVGLLRIDDPCVFNAGDLNADGWLDAADGILIGRLSVGRPLNPDGSSKTGQDWMADKADGGYALGLGAAAAAPGRFVEVPLLLSSTEGVAGIDVAISLDPNLQFHSATPQGNAAGFQIAWNTTPGTVRIAMSADQAMGAGEGAVALLRFGVAEHLDPGMTLPLTLSDAVLYSEYAERFDWYGMVARTDGEVEVTEPTDDRLRLEVLVVGNGMVAPTPDAAGYLPGAAATLTAQPGASSMLSRWEVNGAARAASDAITLTLYTDTTVVAYFEDVVALPDTVLVPPTTGLEQAEAVQMIIDADLTPVVVLEYSTTVAPGTVLRQTPDSGTEVEYAAIVTVWVAVERPTTTTPNVSNQTEADAVAAILSANLRVGAVSYECSNTVARGNILRQIPTADAVIMIDDAVSLVVSTGQCPDYGCAPDTSAPVIDLMGDTTVYVECGAPYVEPGYSAWDQCVGPVNNNFTVGGDALDTAVPGEYTLTYDVSDPSGNAAARRTRTVIVTDTLPPTLQLGAAPTGATLAEDGFLVLECGVPWTEPADFAAGDACAGDLGAPQSALDDGAAGVFAWAWALDPDTGDVLWQDENAPMATAYDVFDGLAGDYLLLYEARDGNGNVYPPRNEQGLPPIFDGEGRLAVADETGALLVDFARLVRITDNDPPVLTLKGVSGSMTMECGTPYALPEAEALDECDGAVTVEVANPNGFNPANPTHGVYNIVYTARDRAGRTASETFTITVIDQAPPVVSIAGGNTLTVECGKSFALPGATALDGCDGPVTATAVDLGGLTPDAPRAGVYNVVYESGPDSAGRIGTATLTVTAADTEPPTVTLNGPASVTVACGEAYVDAGATAQDACDGMIGVTAVGAPDVSAPGEYEVVYTALDAAGNSASATRKISVTAPCATDADKPACCAKGCNAAQSPQEAVKHYLGDWLLLGLSLAALLSLTAVRGKK